MGCKNYCLYGQNACCLECQIKDQCNPESSKYWGIMVAVPYMKEPKDEFQNPTPIDDANVMGWELKVVKPCRMGLRKRSMTELLFCMLRSGR